RAGERASRLARDADDVLLLLALVGARVGATGLAGHGDAHCFDPRAVVQLEQVLHESVPRLFPSRDAERFGAGARRDPLEDLAAQSANAGQILPVALHGGGEELAPSRLVEIEGAVIAGEHSAAVHQKTISIAWSPAAGGADGAGATRASACLAAGEPPARYPASTKNKPVASDAATTTPAPCAGCLFPRTRRSRGRPGVVQEGSVSAEERGKCSLGGA